MRVPAHRGPSLSDLPGGFRRPGERADGPPRWWALYTRARHEKQVDAWLDARGFEAFLPLVPRARRWHDRKKTVLFPLFPGYVFVRTGRSGLTSALEGPGVVFAVRFDGAPVPIPDADIENVRRLAALLVDADGGAEAAPMIEEGRAVRIVDGAFRGIRGRIRQTRGRQRFVVQVGLEAIGQGIKLELEARHVEVLE